MMPVTARIANLWVVVMMPGLVVAGSTVDVTRRCFVLMRMGMYDGSFRHRLIRKRVIAYTEHAVYK